jgi:signal transduction histidine kinase
LKPSLRGELLSLRPRPVELAEFSYAVAHDLQSPLRAMDGFSRKLQQHHEDDLSPEGRHYLQAIHRNTQQLGRQIDGLLALSRLARRPLQRRRVQPRAIVEQVAHDLRAEHAGRQIDLQIGELAPCYADAHLLRQVFTHLVANALKFTRGREIARIEIDGTFQHSDPTAFLMRIDGVVDSHNE